MKRYAVGIDLGTTHTVVAYAPLDAAAGGVDPIRLLDIEQLVAPGEVAARALLPSLRYHPAPGELAPGEADLPWPTVGTDAGDGTPPAIVGTLARRLGARVPGRLVASAKSWLSHPAVDRTAPILPWGADEDVPRVSPVAASAGYLSHVRAAWNHRFPDAPLEAQEIVLTVPASFDDAARALTVEAAARAGLPDLRLLEEPQAACHDWLFRHRATLAADLAGIRLLLVCDVGGGTTDLSLIRVEPDGEGGAPRLTRIGVGDHLMLGGDNMDLALACLAEARLAGGQPGARLPAARLAQLVERCRAAKETLLAADAPGRATVTLLGGGARLVGEARSVELTREEVERVVVDGFFPRAAPDEAVTRARGGLVEFGLPYAADPAVTRHVAAFLRRHAAASREALGGKGDGAGDRGSPPGPGAPSPSEASPGPGAPSLSGAGPMPTPDAPPMPDALLLNGGVFHADAVARRLAEVLDGWRGAPLARLPHADPDLAVARGAVAHALTRHGRAPTIGGGSARGYFLVLGDDAGAATGPGGRTALPVPAAPATPATAAAGRAADGAGRATDGADARRGVCLLPQGSEPGVEVLLADRTFALRVGRPVRFRLAASAADAGARPRPGEVVALGDDALPLPPLATVVPPRPGDGRREVPVRLAVSLTEIGTLDVHCVADDDASRRWRLAFDLRGAEAADGPGAGDRAPAPPPRLGEALERIERVFGARSREVGAGEVRQLRPQLEVLLGSRERWAAPLLRGLADTLIARARGRRRSADHERVWLNLAGYCLRPGFGAPLDDWRVERLWTLFEGGVLHGRDPRVCAEWWTLWRRVAGGLPEAAQLRLLDDFAINLQGAEAGIARPPSLVAGSDDDMIRLGASLERVPVGHKVEIGDWLAGRLQAPATGRAAAAAGRGRGTGGAAAGAGRTAQAAASAGAADGLTAWALGRLGARRPLHGSAHLVVPPEAAVRWLETIEALDWRKVEAAAFAAAHLARLTGDRARDLPPEVRERVVRRLDAARAAPGWAAMVREVVASDEAAERQLFGESLPPGLRLIA